MAGKTAIAIAKADIVRHFISLAKRVFEHREIAAIFDSQRSFWRLPASMSCKAFIKYMVANSELHTERLAFPARPVLRYTWGDVAMNEVLMSIKPNCYFSHSTAMQMHDLTEQVATTIYVSFEQTAKPKAGGSLEQNRIDMAFHRPTRVSMTTADYRQHTVRLLNGMYTGNTGVIERKDSDNVAVRVTDIERTMIDITVRPEYAGGPFEVLKAFRNAATREISVNRLVAYLKSIAFVYPYHQAIGFYLERSGSYKPSQLDLLRKLPMQYDFYLLHDMKEMEYSSQWRLYYPKGF